MIGHVRNLPASSSNNTWLTTHRNLGMNYSKCRLGPRPLFRPAWSIWFRNLKSILAAAAAARKISNSIWTAPLCTILMPYLRYVISLFGSTINRTQIMINRRGFLDQFPELHDNEFSLGVFSRRTFKYPSPLEESSWMIYGTLVEKERDPHAQPCKLSGPPASQRHFILASRNLFFLHTFGYLPDSISHHMTCQ